MTFGHPALNRCVRDPDGKLGLQACREDRIEWRPPSSGFQRAWSRSPPLHTSPITLCLQLPAPCLPFPLASLHFLKSQYFQAEVDRLPCLVVPLSQHLPAGGPAVLGCEFNFPFLLAHRLPLNTALEVIIASPATPVIQNSSSP